MRRTHRAQRTPNPSLTPLLVQAGAAHTLGNIVTFLSVTLLCAGAYVLAEVMRHPLDAQPAEIIGAAVMIALAATMLFFLFELRTTSRSVHHSHTLDIRGGVHAIPTPPLVPRTEAQSELPFAPVLAKRASAGD
jgi:hypothetical protein